MIDDLSPIGWRAWFDGNRVYDSIKNTWEEIPDDGVIVVMLYHAKRLRSGDGHYRTRYANYDYYWMMPEALNEVFCSNDNPIERYPEAIIKRGKWVSYKEYDKICKEAQNSIEF